MRSCVSPLVCRGRSASLVLLSHPVSNMLVALDREALKAKIHGIRYWTMHCVNLQRAGKLREFDSGYRRSQKKRRCCNGSAVECSGGRVLHHLCWADDLYAMAGTMEHVIRILQDMTNAIERLVMKWKEKSLAVVAGPSAEYKTGDKIVITSSKGRRWEWRVVEGLEAVGSWLDVLGCFEASLRHRLAKANSLFYGKKLLICDPKIPTKRRIHAFYSTCVAAALHGAGEWAYTQSMFQALRIWELSKLRRVFCLRRRPNESWVD